MDHRSHARSGRSIRYVVTVGAIGAALAAGFADGAQLHRCTGPDGAASYQDFPCAQPPGSQAPSRAPGNRPRRSAEETEREIEACPRSQPDYASIEYMAAGIMVVEKPMCDALVPGYKAATDQTYARWKATNPLVAHFEAQPHVRKQIEEMASRPRPTGDALAEVTRTCTNSVQLLRELAQAPWRNKPVEPDRRFSTPNRTLDFVRSALREGRKADVLRPLAGETHPSMEKALPSLTRAQMNELAAALEGYRFRGWISEECRGAFATIGDDLGGGLQSNVVTFNNVGGEWRVRTIRIDAFARNGIR